MSVEARRRKVRRAQFLLKSLVWAGGLTPITLLIWWGFHDDLTANPIERITRFTGYWTLLLLLITLSVTPLRRITGWNRLIQLRRPIGLFAFFYATLHFLIYLVLDHFFAFQYIIEDILIRPYITIGFTGFVLLIPLAATSTKGMIRRLGGKRWRRLHYMIYVTASLGVVHFLWSVKADERVPMIFGTILLGLFALRLPRLKRAVSRKPARPRRTAPTARPAESA